MTDRLGAWLLAASLLCTASCSTLREAPRIGEMSEAELSSYCARVEAQVAALTSAAIGEGDIQPEDAERIAGILDALVLGGAPGVGLPALLDLDGYAGLGLTLVLLEIDAELARRGAYESDGWASGREVLRAIAAGMRP